MGQLALFRIDLEACPFSADQVLSEDEHRRADAFVFPRDRNRFMLARAALRNLLGHRTGENPAALRFGYGPKGKPELARNPSPQFNLSHSGGVALVALGGTDPVGIDVEAVVNLPEIESVARHCFTEAERALIAGSADQQLQAFFRLWTRKEAALKALGSGFSVPPASVEVARGDWTPRVRLPDGCIPEAFTLIEVDAGPGFAAAVAAFGRHEAAPLQQWPALYSAEVRQQTG